MKQITGESAVVVGGGMAGLASAIALRRTGWRVQVFEQVDEFGDVGARPPAADQDLSQDEGVASAARWSER